MSAVSDEWWLALQTRLLHLRGRIALQAISLSPPAIPGRCPGHYSRYSLPGYDTFGDTGCLTQQTRLLHLRGRIALQLFHSRHLLSPGVARGLRRVRMVKM